MVSERAKILIGMALAALISSGFFFTFINIPQPTTAQKMILKAEEIGPGWTYHERYYYPDNFVNLSSGVKGDYDLGNESGVQEVGILLTVFNSTEACNAAFENLNSSFYSGYGNKDWCNYSIVPIGDKAIYLDHAVYFYGVGYSKNNSPEYMFMRDNALCRLYCGLTGDGPFAWQKGVLLDIANIQLQKIDQYLIEHPGAN